MPSESVTLPSTLSALAGTDLNVAVLGATGLVGHEMLRLLEQRGLPPARLRPLASSRSRSRTVSFAGETLAVRPVDRDAFDGVDLVLASAGGDVSREWLPIASEGGSVCIDNTSAFRMQPDVPLVVPEVNAAALRGISLGAGHGGAIIANPNCSTIQLVVALEPLRRAFGLERVLVSTYQSMSGAGRRATEIFRDASAAHLRGEGSSEHPGVPVFDVLPCIGDLDGDGHTAEEQKMMRETSKILGEEIPVDVTCVRVPVLVGHAEAVVVQTREPVTPERAAEVLSSAPGLRVHPAPQMPTPAELAGSLETHVGRIRRSQTFENGLQLWVVADNLLKGAAWNAVQISETLLEA